MTGGKLGVTPTFNGAGSPARPTRTATNEHRTNSTETSRCFRFIGSLRFFSFRVVLFSVDLGLRSILRVRPARIGIVSLHLLDDVGGLRPEVFLINLALLVDDEGH